MKKCTHTGRLPRRAHVMLLSTKKTERLAFVQVLTINSVRYVRTHISQARIAASFASSAFFSLSFYFKKIHPKHIRLHDDYFQFDSPQQYTRWLLIQVIKCIIIIAVSLALILDHGKEARELN